MKINLKRAALVSIISSMFFIISNVVAIIYLYTTNGNSWIFLTRMTLIALVYCLCLLTNAYVGYKMLKMLKEKK